ncbi:glycosyltransferase [Brevundimonas sp.]|uniref:glycosyltransferase n=1 Tax=Brevundimonas sp. TaxID=1871086 RepID=UPI0035AF78C3
MSLRRLALAIHGAVSTSGPPEPRTALIFVLNSAFLRPFHVLVYSLARVRTLTKYPIIVISEDAAVFRDPLVRAVTDHSVLAGPEQIAEFANISPERVREDLRKGWIAKYTFLKWLVFQDYGFDRHIYIDADIVALNDCEHLAALSEHDLYGAPVFKRDLIIDETGARRPVVEREQRMSAFLADGNERSLNSGVMVINRRAMEPEFRAGLIATAESKSYTVEQAVVRDFIRRSDRYSMGVLSSYDNFNHGFLASLSAPTQLKHLDRVRLLHYVGADKKPWNAAYMDDPTRIERLTDSLWRILERESRTASPLTRRAAQRLDRLEKRAASPAVEEAVEDQL